MVLLHATLEDVLRSVLEKFQLHELRPIEMVLTDSPSEVARYEAGLPVQLAK